MKARRCRAFSFWVARTDSRLVFAVKQKKSTQHVSLGRRSSCAIAPPWLRGEAVYLRLGEPDAVSAEATVADPSKFARASALVRDAGAPLASRPTIASVRARIPLVAAKEPRRGNDGGNGSGTAVITRTRTQTRRPNMYRVLLLNDDYTPMEFVVAVLRRYFNKGPEEATRIMLHVHHHGVGECGVFTYEIAETKVTQVMDYARKHQHPLQCIMEKK
jgi:ATP-dependent Clp protease adaptor protein ClpS